MLELRPNCELCDRDLAPASPEAMICTYECTLCRNCVEAVLQNVCPNCGGNFCPRPVRPSKEHRQGVSLARQPASAQRVHSKYSEEEIRSFSTALSGLAAKDR